MKSVIYTDGSAIINPGKIGFAYHGYCYEETSTKPIKAEGWTLTDKGYIDSIHQDDVWVIPIKYIDFIGTISNIATNNIAEILAVIKAYEHIKLFNIEEVIIYTDSKYVENGVNEWLEVWTSNNFIKSNGEKVLNSEYWKKLSDLIDDAESSGIEVTVKWIKAHNKNIGNERADYLANIASNYNNSALRLMDNLNACVESDVKGYWDVKYPRNPLLNFKRIYFNSISDYNKPGTYYQANPSDKDMYIGKRLPGDGYSIVRLNSPDAVIEEIIERQIEVCNGYNGVYLCKLENVFKKNVLKFINDYGGYALRPINQNNDLECVNKVPITMELNPTGLSLRAIDNFNYLEDILDIYVNLKKDINVDLNKVIKLDYIDITDELFETVTAKKKEIRQLKSSISPSTKNIKLKIKRHNNLLTIPLTLGIDLPNRNNLRKLNAEKVKVNLLTWSPSEKSVGYAIVIEYNKDIGIWTDFFSNRIYLK